MLPEIAAEALHFLSRRDLDNACAVSKWLDALIAQCCEVFPLRPVAVVKLYQGLNDLVVTVYAANDADSETRRSFRSLDEAANFIGTVVRHSYVEELGFYGFTSGSMALLPDHFTTLISAMQNGAVRLLELIRVNLRALDADALQVVVGCGGLRSLAIRGSVFPAGFEMDDLLPSSVAQGVRQLSVCENNNDTPLRFSDYAVLAFFFPAEAPPGGQSRKLSLEGCGITDMFVTKFFA